MKLYTFRTVLPAGPGWSCSKDVYKLVWHIPLLSVQWINSWRWTDELSEIFRVSWQNTFVKLVHLFGFIKKKSCQAVKEDYISKAIVLINPYSFLIYFSNIILYKITLLNLKNKYFLADIFCWSFNLEGKKHVMNRRALFCVRCIIYTCYTTVWKRSSLCSVVFIVLPY